MVARVAFAMAAFLSVAVSSPPLQLEETPKFYNLNPQNGLDITEVGTSAILPSSLDPQSYILKLQPVLYNDSSNGLLEWTLPGSVEITGTAIAATGQIFLNIHQSLQIDSETVEVRDQNNVLIPSTPVDPGNAAIYTINLSRNLTLNETYTVSMKFVGVIQAGTSGLYRAYYNTPDGIQKRIAVTQFEYRSARMAFPCFDEPSFNSIFTISLARRDADGYQTLCNTNLSSTTPHEQHQGWVWDHYETSVKMPTYLVAIVVSDFTSESAPAGLFHTPVKVYGEPALIARGGGVFSATASALVMAKLEEIFQYPYEMPKVDSVAVPRNYFAAGAMENWGLITYRDNALLYYTGESVETQKQSIASVIAHEQGHQWFGNLVTCKYWSHIWLNEGFATYVAQLSFSEVYPEFEERREFLYDSVQGSMAYDIGPNQPILNLEADRDEVTSSGTIIYDKAGSIIRMMEGFLGYETLINALREYLKKHAYQSAEQDQLFNTMHEYVNDKIPAGKTFKEIMDTWTVQPGYPLIRVNKLGNELVNISQARYLPAGQTSPQAGLWEVPIPIVTPDAANFNNHTPTVWLTKDTPITIYRHETNKWIILNPDAFGYYRVLYDDDLVKLIQAQLNANQSVISGLTRSQLIDDYFTFANHGHVNITTALDMTTSFREETDYVVWYPLFRHLTKSLQMFQNLGNANLRGYLAPKLDSALLTVSWMQGPTESGTKVIYRSRLADWACSLESDGCKATAQIVLAAWKANPSMNPIGLDLQPVLYCSIVAHGDGGYDFIKGLYQNASTSAFQKGRLLNALSCATKETEIRDLLELALDPTSPISGSTVAVYQRAAGNNAARQIVLRAIQDEATFEKLREQTGGVNFFSSIVSSLSTYLNTAVEREELQAFIETRRTELGSIMNSLNNSINAIRNNEAWVAQNYNVMNSWFAANA